MISLPKGVNMRKLYIKRNEKDKQAWIDLLNQEGIRHEQVLDETFGEFENDQLIATASRHNNVIKCVAVDSKHQGGALFNQIITLLHNQIFKEGYPQTYVYTKPQSQKAFEFLGFKTIESVDNDLVFMEKAITGFSAFLKKLSKEKVDAEKVSSIVMNANPFTLGHLHLVTKASTESDIVHLFVLSEEMSAFDAQTRFDLVKSGTNHLKNVIIHPTGSYLVSAATFPSYFLKEDADVTEIQARLDARVFVNHIAPTLDITKRYVGSEPLSFATNIYNQSLMKEFNDKIKLEIIERIENDDDTISASKVRAYLTQNNIEATKPYVPETTYQFFLSEKGQRIIQSLQHEKSES